MCGIAAFSKPEGSAVNARLLAHHLLTQIESRGSHASGFAYVNADGSVGIYKNPTPGSQLGLQELPRDARTVILHTRYATQGAPEDNRNNHPVISTDRRIALVHNGVISNDRHLRAELGIDGRHGEVDSLVIPSLIAQQGTAGLSKLAGYAAIAWIDNQDAKNLRIAKLKNSPVSYTHLFDGTFVMASTESLLVKAMLGAGQSFGGVFELAESKMITVQNGFIMDHEPAPRMTYDYGSYQRHSNATSGGHGTTATTPVSRVTARPLPAAKPAAKGSEDDNRKVYIPEPDEAPVDVDAYLADLEEWRAKRSASDEATATKAMALMDGPKDTWTTEEFNEYIAELEARDAQDHMSCTLDGGESNYSEGFYILDGEGDISHHPSLEDLETKLKWFSEMRRTDLDIFPNVEDKVNWVNHIMDIGHIETDGELVSWVDDMASVDDFESPAVRNLQYIREGLGSLVVLRGA